MVRAIVATAGCARFGTQFRRLVTKWVRQVPVAVAQERHGCRYEDRTHEGRVQQHGHAEAEAHLLKHNHVARRDPAEDSHRD
jgi:hypothetical protein